MKVYRLIIANHTSFHSLLDIFFTILNTYYHFYFQIDLLIIKHYLD